MEDIGRSKNKQIQLANMYKHKYTLYYLLLSKGIRRFFNLIQI